MKGISICFLSQLQVSVLCDPLPPVSLNPTKRRYAPNKKRKFFQSPKTCGCPAPLPRVSKVQPDTSCMRHCIKFLVDFWKTLLLAEFTQGFRPDLLKTFFFYLPSSHKDNLLLTLVVFSIK